MVSPQVVSTGPLLLQGRHTENWVRAARNALIGFAIGQEVACCLGSGGERRLRQDELHCSLSVTVPLPTLCEAHERMGFHGGWGLCTDELVAVVAKN